jgi:hypothetical protein
MKTAVDTVFVGKERQYTRGFLQMCSLYMVDRVVAVGLRAGSALGQSRWIPGELNFSLVNLLFTFPLPNGLVRWSYGGACGRL